jgi:hypothetical protein
MGCKTIFLGFVWGFSPLAGVSVPVTGAAGADLVRRHAAERLLLLVVVVLLLVIIVLLLVLLPLLLLLVVVIILLLLPLPHPLTLPHPHLPLLHHLALPQHSIDLSQVHLGQELHMGQLATLLQEGVYHI